MYSTVFLVFGLHMQAHTSNSQSISAHPGYCTVSDNFRCTLSYEPLPTRPSIISVHMIAISANDPGLRRLKRNHRFMERPIVRFYFSSHIIKIAPSPINETLWRSEMTPQYLASEATIHLSLAPCHYLLSNCSPMHWLHSCRAQVQGVTAAPHQRQLVHLSW